MDAKEWPDRERVMPYLEDLRRRYMQRDFINAINRALVFRRHDADPVQMGTFVPPPLDESQLIIRYLGADPWIAAVRKVASITANAPRVRVVRVPTAPGGAVTGEADRHAAAQQAALNAIFHKADPNGQLQTACAWAQVVDGVGWYLTTPYEAGFGLPDRAFIEGLSADEARAQVQAGRLRPGRARHPDTGKRGYWEQGDIWKDRRAEVGKQKALNGDAVFTMEMCAAPSVYYEKDKIGFSRIAIIENISVLDAEPGSDFMHRLSEAGAPTDLALFGVRRNKDGMVTMGMPAGGVVGEKLSQPDSGEWTMARIFDREYVTYVISDGPRPEDGVVVWHARHGMSEVPVYPAAGHWTPSSRPEEEFVPILAPLIAGQNVTNQIVTMLSNVATTNATARFRAEAPVGARMPQRSSPDDTNESDLPRSEPAIGLDPEVMSVLPPGWEAKQIKIDASELLQMYEIFVRKQDEALPSEAESGEGSLRGSAWSRRIAMAKSAEVNAQPIEYHRVAVQNAARAWTRALRSLDVPLHFLSPPERGNDGNFAHQFIVYDPKKGSDSVLVEQSTLSQQEQLAREVHGADLFQQRLISELVFHADYRGVEDPAAAVEDNFLQRILDYVNEKTIPMIGEALGGMGPEVLAEEVPAVARALAQEAAAASGAGGIPGAPDDGTGAAAGIAAAHGLAVPGVSQGVGQPSLAPLNGEVPA